MLFDLLYYVNRWSYKVCLFLFVVFSGLFSNRICCNKFFFDIEFEIVVILGNVICEICCFEFYNDYFDGKEDFKLFIYMYFFF